MVTWKTSEKVKGRLVIGAPVKAPMEELMQYIQDNAETWKNGLDDMSEDDITNLVNERYRAVEKKKLIRHFEKRKIKERN